MASAQRPRLTFAQTSSGTAINICRMTISVMIGRSTTATIIMTLTVIGHIMNIGILKAIDIMAPGTVNMADITDE